jgi:hypothetical protein
VKVREVYGALWRDMYSAHCVITAVKYVDRAGRKGPKEVCMGKAAWYLQMAAHMEGEAPDPRVEALSKYAGLAFELQKQIRGMQDA